MWTHKELIIKQQRWQGHFSPNFLSPPLSWQILSYLLHLSALWILKEFKCGTHPLKHHRLEHHNFQFPCWAISVFNKAANSLNTSTLPKALKSVPTQTEVEIPVNSLKTPGLEGLITLLQKRNKQPTKNSHYGLFYKYSIQKSAILPGIFWQEVLSDDKQKN